MNNIEAIAIIEEFIKNQVISKDLKDALYLSIDALKLKNIADKSKEFTIFN